jgi:membrane protein required for colicin V production
MMPVETDWGTVLPWVVDGIALLLILGSAVTGMIKGAIKILGAIAGFIAAIILGWRFTPDLAALITPHINSAFFGKVLAFLAIFIAVMIVTALVVFGLNKLFKAILLGWVNKLVGFVIGLIIGTFVVCVILWISLLIYPELADLYLHTRLVRLLAALVYLFAPTVGSPPAAVPA